MKIAGFIAIYAIFGAMLAYLLFFNTGLEMTAAVDPSTGNVNVMVKNNSAHLIENITVNYKTENGETIKVADLQALNPAEQKEFVAALDEGANTAEFLASAPRHLSVGHKISARANAPVSLKYEMKSPELAFVETPFKIAIKVCNDSRTSAGKVEISARYDRAAISAKDGLISDNIGGNGCADFEFEFTPKMQGKTTIYFNIQGQNTTAETEKEIEVR